MISEYSNPYKKEYHFVRTSRQQLKKLTESEKEEK